MEGTNVSLDEVEHKLRSVYGEAMNAHDLNNALAAIHGLLEVHDRRDGTDNRRGVGFGNED